MTQQEKRKSAREQLVEQTAKKYTRALMDWLEEERKLNKLMAAKPEHFTTIDPETSQPVRVPMSHEQWQRDIRIQAAKVRKGMREAARFYAHLRTAMRVGKRPAGWEEFVKPPLPQDKPTPYPRNNSIMPKAPDDMDTWGKPSVDDTDDDEGDAL